MPDNNTDKVIADVNKDTDKNLNEDVDLNNNNGNADADTKSVPLATFLKIRDELKDLKGKLDKVDKEKDKERQTKLAEEGKHKELISELEKKISELEPEANEYKEYKTSKRESLKKDLGDKYKPYMDKLTIAELEELEKDLLTTKNIEATDTGVNSNGKTKVILTDAQKAEARTMLVSDEQYIEIMKNRKGNKNG